jgi:hypothetical protein
MPSRSQLWWREHVLELQRIDRERDRELRCLQREDECQLRHLSPENEPELLLQRRLFVHYFLIILERRFLSQNPLLSSRLNELRLLLENEMSFENSNSLSSEQEHYRRARSRRQR